MAAITWNNSLSVKVASIDDQHKKLIELINEFYDNIRDKSNDELILNLVDGMKRYTVEHFSTEERYMKLYNYPEYKAHKKEHQEFIDKVVAFENKLKTKQIIVSFEITSFLKDWVKKHILSSDKNYSNFFVSKGII